MGQPRKQGHTGCVPGGAERAIQGEKVRGRGGRRTLRGGGKQGRAHMSTAFVYEVEPSMISGARYLRGGRGLEGG
jgi:hypothetical protein